MNQVSQHFPHLYVILDSQLHSQAPDLVREFVDAGVRLLQIRHKSGSAKSILEQTNQIMAAIAGRNARLIVNDRADITAVSGAGGVHVGQEDISARAARKSVGPNAWVGISTHTLEQVRAADAEPVDYIAIGPIFATSTKVKPDPVVGLEFIRAARALTSKPLVAIGGITLQNADEVFDAGADSVAVARDILSALDPIVQAKRFLALAEEKFR
ncbi:MAG: thiamine phosphate synthase [Acidobacteria bacterium]|nr:thiamine phosphate synthase [Acidobacteriota bacterium]